LRQPLDREGEERRKLTAILTDQRERAIITAPPETASPPAPVKPALVAAWRRTSVGGTLMHRASTDTAARSSVLEDRL
jgi:hypothetical protein